MLFKDIPIKKKLIIVTLLTSGTILLLTCASFFAYEYYIFRQSTVQNLSTLGKIIAANSTAALAFDNPDDAREILSAITAEQHIVGAVLLDTAGNFFAKYPSSFIHDSTSVKPGTTGFHFTDSHLEGYQPVVQGERILGTLFLKSDLKAINERFKLYGIIGLLVVLFSTIIAYLISNFLQLIISQPIVELAKTASIISERQDYSVRVKKIGNDELGYLTDAFNHMLDQIQKQNKDLGEFNKNLEQMVMDRTRELEIVNKEQKLAKKEISKKNKELAQALQELKIAEEHLIKLNNSLEKRVKNRTMALLASEKAFKIKNLELEKTNIDLDNFIYTASHDLKSPIVNLEGLVNLMRKRFKSVIAEDDVKLLDMVDLSIQKLKSTIRDLAEITKVQKDLEEDAQEISFKQLLDDVKDGINTNIIESKAFIREDFQITHLVYPRKNLRSIIYNLLSNAIKYRAKDRLLEIDIRTYAENGSTVLMIKDNGMGISKDQQPKLFTMFKRLHTHVEGTGIGLYIIKRIIENRGGWIEVESDLDKGTTFRAYFKTS